MPLTPRQAAFVREYLVDLNATQAAVRAGYSPRNADKLGPRLVGQSRVAAEIARLMAAREKAVEHDAKWVIRRLAEEADFKGEGSTHSARVRALEVLARHHGLLVDRVEVKATARLEVVEEIVDAPPQDGPAAPGPG